MVTKNFQPEWVEKTRFILTSTYQAIEDILSRRIRVSKLALTHVIPDTGHTRLVPQHIMWDSLADHVYLDLAPTSIPGSNHPFQ